MFSMLYEANFTYDSSMPIYENKPPSFPYTMDYQLAHDCMIPPCPNRWKWYWMLKSADVILELFQQYGTFYQCNAL